MFRNASYIHVYYYMYPETKEKKPNFCPNPTVEKRKAHYWKDRVIASQSVGLRRVRPPLEDGDCQSGLAYFLSV
jgi:hypothetical protein